MKKYVLILFSAISFHTHAMEVADTIATALSHVNHETKEEFVERTKLLKLPDIKDKYLKHLPSVELYQIVGRYCAHCPDNKIVALLQRGTLRHANKHGEYQDRATLAVIDKENDLLLHTRDLEPEQYLRLTVSRGGNMIAAIYAKTLLSKQHALAKHYDYKDYEDVLTITNLATEQSEFHAIPYNLKIVGDHPAIAFNKQGTCIIVYGKDRNENPRFDGPPSRYEIHPVTVTTPDYTEILGEYVESAISLTQPK